MLKHIMEALKAPTPKTAVSTVNLQNVGWYLDAEGSNEKATQGANLALELLWPYYDAVLVVYPDEFEDFEPMLRSAPGEHLYPVEQESLDAFKPEALRESGAIFTYSYSLTRLFSRQRDEEAEKANHAVSNWLEGMRELTKHHGVNCWVILVGENPFGPDFPCYCRALGVGRVLITNWDDTGFDGSKINKLHRLPRNPFMNSAHGTPNRMYKVTELLDEHVPRLARFKEEHPINQAKSA